MTQAQRTVLTIMARGRCSDGAAGEGEGVSAVRACFRRGVLGECLGTPDH